MKGRGSVHFSSAKSDWETPIELFDKLNAEFSFTLDVCATLKNRLCESFISPEEDALTKRWVGHCFMNPPYGRGIGAWCRKAFFERYIGNAKVMVALLPARTDTQWWHEYVMRAYERRFLPGRLKFGGAENSAPFPSVVVIF